MGHHHHHGHDHGHAHAHDDGGNARRLVVVLVLTAVYMLAEAIGGWLSHSLALIADAGHMLSDVAALGLSLFAVWISRRPPTPARSYGYQRTEILATFALQSPSPQQEGLRDRNQNRYARMGRTRPRCGDVTAFTAVAFEVGERPPGAASVWLGLAAIFSVDDRGVSLLCNIHDIGRYAVNRTSAMAER